MCVQISWLGYSMVTNTVGYTTKTRRKRSMAGWYLLARKGAVWCVVRVSVWSDVECCVCERVSDFD